MVPLPAPSRGRQFAAVVKKNLILQTRSRNTVLGIGGWGALILQVGGLGPAWHAREAGGSRRGRWL